MQIMTRFLRNAVVIGILMLGAFALSLIMTPELSTAPVQFDLQTLAPDQFGDWRKEEQPVQGVINPQAQEFIDNLYSQTLSRTYINNNGRRIMLSLAYGTVQSGYQSEIHRPEVCYPAQGFQLIKKWKDVVGFKSTTLPVMRIVTQLGHRHEPVTYWIRIGDSLVRGAAEQSLARVGYGLTGHIPDGILFRVSEINSDEQGSFSLQDQFIRALLSSLTSDQRKILIGSSKSKTET